MPFEGCKRRFRCLEDGLADRGQAISEIEMKYRKTALFGCAFVASMSLAAPAYAYLDAGTTSMILQMLIGSFFGALLAVRLYWRKLKSFFVRGKGEVDSHSEQDETQN